ncbi:RCC1 domain-containing protein [Chondromyces crocatus]|uniref:Uncharacterized protein n=1 Tax=Chondromyces crocatus TaxID=52 RepID=A0A0K1EQU9_CHOCO|nr:hypothetical protein [Chondromyces crocatus]AKT43027.1 uncharacterized protein CMC5_072540 [Chondromyces crocatus]
MKRGSTFLFVAMSQLACGVAHVDLGSSDPAEESEFLFAMGASATCAVGSDGILRCYGVGTDGRFGVPPSTFTETCAGEPCVAAKAIRIGQTPTSSVTLGDSFLCATLGGDTRCAGGNSFGMLGRGQHDRDAHTNFVAVDGRHALSKLVAGRGHACGLSSSGGVWCWGIGVHGQLGRDPNTLGDCGLPANVEEATRLAVSPTDILRCSEVPALVPGLTGITDLRAGPFATCAYSAPSGWRCFGRNVSGSLGVGTSHTGVFTPTALTVAGTMDVALGPTHGCLVDREGFVQCFGRAELGQLGIGTTAPDTCEGSPCALAPVMVRGLGPARRVAVGDAHSCVLLHDGSVSCFGSDSHGQIGDGDTTSDDCGGKRCSLAPRSVRSYVGIFKQISAHGDATCATNGYDGLFCWGDGTRGELGQDVPQILSTPTRVPIP